MINSLISLIYENISLFDGFDKIYIFGSILDLHKDPKDIDVLLLYSVYSKELTEHIDVILRVIDIFVMYHLDLTVLSINEEKEFNFLSKQGLKYIRVK